MRNSKVGYIVALLMALMPDKAMFDAYVAEAENVVHNRLGLKSDVRGVSDFIGGLVMVLVVVLIFSSLIGAIITAVNGTTGLSTGAHALYILIPLFLVVALILAIVAWMMHYAHGGD